MADLLFMLTMIMVVVTMAM